MSEDIFEVENLSFSYKNANKIFDCVNFTVKGSSIIGLLGENGAGKTTLFSLIKGDKKPISGRITMRISRDKIINLPQVLNLSGTLKNYEILGLIACLSRINIREALSRLEKRWSKEFFYRYDKIKNKNTYAVSYGEKRWLIISLMLGVCDSAQLFLLDEPTSGIDIQFKTLLWELIEIVRSEGRTVMFSTHMFDDISSNNYPFLFLTKNGIEKFNNMSDFLIKNNAESPEKAFLQAMSAKRGQYV